MWFLNKQGGSMISKEKIEGDGENIALDTCSFLCREDFIFLNDHRAQNLELLFFSGLKLSRHLSCMLDAPANLCSLLTDCCPFWYFLSIQEELLILNSSLSEEVLFCLIIIILFWYLICVTQTMEQFYEKINDPNHNGATFFAVCRGKVEYY